MHYDRPFNKAIVDLPIRIKGNSKLINQINKINTIWSYHIHIVVLRLPDSWSNWNWKMLVLRRGQGEEKTGVPREEPLGARERTNNKLNPHIFPVFVESIVGTDQQGHRRCFAGVLLGVRLRLRRRLPY